MEGPDQCIFDKDSSKDDLCKTHKEMHLFTFDREACFPSKVSFCRLGAWESMRWSAITELVEQATRKEMEKKMMELEAAKDLAELMLKLERLIRTEAEKMVAELKQELEYRSSDLGPGQEAEAEANYREYLQDHFPELYRQRLREHGEVVPDIEGSDEE